MKLAILSDIHSNLEAVSRCLEYIDTEQPVDTIIVLGDSAGYGADPETCIQLVRKRAAYSVLGNHDAGVIGKTDIMFFNSPAQTAITWQQDRIQENELAYLTELPYSVIAESIRFVHSSPREPEQWKYIIAWYDAIDEFPYFSEKLCFIGHSHIPCIYSEDGITPASEGAFELDRNIKYIINVGSVGQPRDGDPRLSFGIFDKDTYTIEIIRLDYDIKTARQKIIKSNLPKVLGDRLLFGH